MNIRFRNLLSLFAFAVLAFALLFAAGNSVRAASAPVMMKSVAAQSVAVKYPSNVPHSFGTVRIVLVIERRSQFPRRMLINPVSVLMPFLNFEPVCYPTDSVSGKSKERPQRVADGVPETFTAGKSARRPKPELVRRGRRHS